MEDKTHTHRHDLVHATTVHTTIICRNLEFYNLPPSTKQIQIWLIETNSVMVSLSQGANGGVENLFLGLGVWTVTPVTCPHRTSYPPGMFMNGV